MRKKVVVTTNISRKIIRTITATYNWRRRDCRNLKKYIYILYTYFCIQSTNFGLPELSLVDITRFGRRPPGPIGSRAFGGPGRLFLKACTSLWLWATVRHYHTLSQPPRLQTDKATQVLLGTILENSTEKLRNISSIEIVFHTALFVHSSRRSSNRVVSMVMQVIRRRIE
jgi:hypothetical protein